ncbi:MAG TPA: CAP domain-containing protein [Thermoanaerobaculia bacterium]|nr:CAP domain-containing protein [Thermoanaerobaculia bacterium]
MKTLLLALLCCTAFSASAADDFSAEISVENVIRVMNAYRAEAALPPLVSERRLHLAAEDRMRHMEEESYWAHQAPDGTSPFVWVKAREYNYQRVGENLATGFETAKVLVEAWMESPGHRANIMSPHFEDCGIAIIDGAVDGPAVGRSIVVLFGRKHEPAPVIARGSK